MIYQNKIYQFQLQLFSEVRKIRKLSAVLRLIKVNRKQKIRRKENEEEQRYNALEPLRWVRVRLCILRGQLQEALAMER